MTTKSNAHVCTPGLVPILGQIEDDEFMLGHPSIKPKGLNSCDPWYGPDKEAWLRRRSAARANMPPANWPGQRLRILRSVERTHDATAHLHDAPQLSDHYYYRTYDGHTIAVARRHSGEDSRKWLCLLFLQDQAGAEWVRELAAVTDDFGWLVEVPAC